MMTKQAKLKKQAYESDLKSRSLSVLLYLIDRSNKELTCFPAIPTMAEQLHISESTVKRSLRELAEKGYIKKESRFREKNRGQSSNLYTLILFEGQIVKDSIIMSTKDSMERKQDEEELEEVQVNYIDFAMLQRQKESYHVAEKEQIQKQETCEAKEQGQTKLCYQKQQDAQVCEEFKATIQKQEVLQNMEQEQPQEFKQSQEQSQLLLKGKTLGKSSETASYGIISLCGETVVEATDETVSEEASSVFYMADIMKILGLGIDVMKMPEVLREVNKAILWKVSEILYIKKFHHMKIDRIIQLSDFFMQKQWWRIFLRFRYKKICFNEKINLSVGKLKDIWICGMFQPMWPGEGVIQAPP
ncbi:MAG: winged helix-turn-helix transcriptional regulator [Lachnospiraceae bacterium]|nr:winged helix-turn-helix transcriptional regulator [Lachnospiraceae bacterium]